MKQRIIIELSRLFFIAYPFLWSTTWLLAVPFKIVDWDERWNHFAYFREMHSLESWKSWWIMARDPFGSYR